MHVVRSLVHSFIRTYIGSIVRSFVGSARSPQRENEVNGFENIVCIECTITCDTLQPLQLDSAL